jgi:5-formyltetrahydrofolate cyclo-ligase
LKTKKEIRKEIWDLLEEKNIITFPRPVYGRIPNFIGANIAADKLNELSIWKKARIVKSNPDSPQKWVRELALKHGKTVYMAFPRLREEKCFIKLNPKKLINVSKASTIKGALRYGESIYPDEMEKVDIIIIGSVAVTKHGEKIGKGGGFSDLEYAIIREYEIANENTPTISTIHPLQILEYTLPMEKHDVPLDYIITRKGITKTNTDYDKPKNIYWDIIDDKINEIPILKKLERK